MQPVHLVLGCTVLAIAVMMILMLRPDAHHQSPSSSPAPSHSFTSGGADNSGEHASSQGGQSPTITPPPADTVEGGGKADPGLTGMVTKPKDNAPETPNPAPTLTPAPEQAAAPNGAEPAVPPLPHEVSPYQVPSTLSPQGSDDQHTVSIKTAMERIAKDPKMPFAVDQLLLDPRNGNILVEYSVPNVGGVSETKKGLIYAGFRLIWAAMPLSPETHVYTLRGKAYSDGQKQLSLALTADVTPTQAEQAQSAADYATAASYLNNPLWRPDLANAPL